MKKVLLIGKRLLVDTKKRVDRIVVLNIHSKMLLMYLLKLAGLILKQNKKYL